jgi:hypothetical protein
MMDIKQMNTAQFWELIQKRMSKFGGIVRPLKNLFNEGKELIGQIYNLNTILILKDNREIIEYLRIRDALITQQYILESILNYHESNGKSRGSYLIHREKLNKSLNEKFVVPPGELEQFKFIISDINLEDKIQTIQSHTGTINFEWEPVRGIPHEFSWFENVLKDFSNGKIFN